MTQRDIREAAAAAAEYIDLAKHLQEQLAHAKAALRCIYGHAMDVERDSVEVIELIEETCCTVLNEHERIYALCEHDEAGT